MVHLGFVVMAFRVMFGMGFAKFRKKDERTRKNTFIFHFLEWQPMATVTAFYLRTLPMFCHKLLLWGLFVVEVIVPWLAFAGSDGRIIFAVCTLGLQIGIALCGNYGIFNLLMSVVTLPLLAAAPIWVMPDLSVTSLVSCCLLLGAIPYLVVLDSWNQGMWAYVPTRLRERARLLAPLARIYRPFVSFRIWNAYGIFVPRGSYPKMVPTIQMSQDGEIWEDVVPRYMTNSVTQKPKRFAPYHPRLDHFIFYNHFRTSDFKIQCMMGFNPYYVHEVGLTEKIVEHLYRGNPVAQSLFAQVPFDDPAHVRVAIFAYHMNPITVAHETGVYWVRELVGCSETIERIELNELTGIQPVYNPFIFDSLEVDHGGVATYKIGDRAVPIQRHAMIPVEPSKVAPESFVYVTQQI
tara:strand:+ start:1121 stop:2341 length:1221 start_codon:yes stop_codon:yes gene_type:complete